jgi:hypothetical protein
MFDIKSLWFGYIARQFRSGGGGYFTRSNDFYLPSLRSEGGQHPVGKLLSKAKIALSNA